MKSEKRKYMRIANDIDVLIKEIDEDRPIGLDESISMNISGNGILLQHDKPLHVDTIVGIKFLMPNSFEMFEGLARVVRVESYLTHAVYEIGITFINLTINEERELDYFLRQSQTSEDPD